MKKYLIIIIVITSVISALCGIINDVTETWDGNMEVVKHTFGNVAEFWRRMIYGQDKRKRSQPRETNDFAYKVHDVATTFSTDVEKAFLAVKIKTESMYKNMKGYFGSNSKATHPSILKHLDYRKPWAANITTIKGDKTMYPILQSKEIDHLYQNTTTEVTVTTKVNNSTPITLNPIKGKTGNHSRQSVPHFQGDNFDEFLLEHKLKLENDGTRYPSLRKTDLHLYQNSSDAQSDEVANTSLKHSFKINYDDTENSTLQSISNTKYHFLDVNDYLSQVNPFSQSIKVEDSLLQHSSRYENEVIEPLIEEEDEVQTRIEDEELSTLHNKANLEKNKADREISDIINKSSQNISNLINDTKILNSTNEHLTTYSDELKADERHTSDSYGSVSEENTESLTLNATSF
ncbi:unnamed protein product [Arctia plantaginis]|uniref:Uncharacterized protein n=1 Tax=Arctia plantaginis TaxID=874455 RepID=A0A8S0YQ80_ARCPL|nr:unnamed protein product [Arctia plantaginis]